MGLNLEVDGKSYQIFAADTADERRCFRGNARTPRRPRVPATNTMKSEKVHKFI